MRPALRALALCALVGGVPGVCALSPPEASAQALPAPGAPPPSGLPPGGLPPGSDALPPFPPDSAAGRFASGRAFVFGLSNYGLGAGATLRFRLTDDVSALAEVHLSAARDEREQQFFVGVLGETVVPFKRNYAAILPLHVGIEQRLARGRVEANVRPFVSATVGPSFALQWPYFRDANRDGIRQDGEERLGALRGLQDAALRPGLGGTIALGTYLGRGRTGQGFRVGYTAHYFPGAVDLLELDPRVDGPSRRFFGTPTVTFHVIRLFGD